jgi:hypothetical protein
MSVRTHDDEHWAELLTMIVQLIGSVSLLAILSDVELVEMSNLGLKAIG